MTAFGSPTQLVPVGGAGHFDGRMLGAFRRLVSRAASPATGCAPGTSSGAPRRPTS